MSKKHFIALADAVREMQPKPSDDPMLCNPTAFDGAYRQWESDREALADFCQSQNSQFKRDRWLSYIAGECGPNGGELKGGIHKGRRRDL